MTSPKTPPKNLRDRLAAKVAATMLWPVAKARPESDWARMQKRLSSIGDEKNAGDGREQNPFVRAAQAEAERDAADERAPGRAKNEKPKTAEVRATDAAHDEGGAVEKSASSAPVPPASEDLGAWPPGPVPHGPTAGAAASEAGSRTVKDEDDGEGTAPGKETHDAGAESDGYSASDPDDETEFAAWAREKRGPSREVRGLRQARSLLFRHGVRPPMALFALLLSVAAAAWLYDFWRKPREPQPAGVSSSVTRSRTLVECNGR